MSTKKSQRPMPVRKTKGAPKTAAAVVKKTLTETEAHLALLVPSVAGPSPKVKETLLARIAAQKAAAKPTQPAAAPPGWRFESAAPDSTGWRSGRFPGVRFKTLSVDETRDVVMLLIEMAPGARFPDHPHSLGGDEGIVISGDVINAGKLMRAGDYFYAAEGTNHVDTVSPSGCTALVSLTARAWNQWREGLVRA